MARLTAAARRKLPAKDFADPAHRAFPIENKAHAIAAKRLEGNASPGVRKVINAMANRMLGK